MPRLLLAVSLTLTLTFALFANDWPQWRGPNRDAVSKETGLLKEWPKDGPPPRWKLTDIGTGYSSPSIAAGKVYVQTTKGEDEFLLVLDEKTGKEAWTAAIGKVGKNSMPEYPGTRATPTVAGDRVYCLASAGQLTCVGTDGKQKWQKDLVKDFDGQIGNAPNAYNWQYSESVLVDGDAVVCTPGGETATLVALNKTTGAVIWKSAVPGGDHADYSSIIVVETAGVKQYVQFLRKGVVGVDAKTGKFLWRYDRTASSGANILTPVAENNKVFTSSGMGLGGTVELTGGGGTVTAKELYTTPGTKASIGGAVLVDGHLYGTSGANLFCVEFATGKEKWTEPKIGPASLCYADGRLYIRGHGGTGFEKGALPSVVLLVEPSPEGYREKGRFTQPDRSEKRPAWPHPVVANGGLYLRDQGVLLCYDVKAK